jgi:hypothetical protein
VVWDADPEPEPAPAAATGAEDAEKAPAASAVKRGGASGAVRSLQYEDGADNWSDKAERDSGSDAGEVGTYPPRTGTKKTPAVSIDTWAAGGSSSAQVVDDDMDADLQAALAASRADAEGGGAAAPGGGSSHAAAPSSVSDDLISFVPTEVYGPHLRYGTDQACRICFTEFEDGEDVCITATCMHMIHKDCMAQWLRQGSFTCPICRSEL